MLCACPCSGAFKALHRGAIPLWTPGGSGLHAGAVEVCQWLHASNSHHRISGTSQSNQQIKQQTHNHITGSQIYDLSSHLILLEQSTKSFLLVVMRIDCACGKTFSILLCWQAADLSLECIHLSVSMTQGDLSHLGRIVMQGSFSVWISHKRAAVRMKELARFKPMQRHLFLYEHALLFCKRRDEDNHDRTPFYSFKSCLRVITRKTLSHYQATQTLCFQFTVFLSVCRWVQWESRKMWKEMWKNLKSGIAAEKWCT